MDLPFQVLANSLCETANNISKHQSTAKTLEKSSLAARSLACCVFICTNPEQTRNTRPIKEFTVAGTREVAKLWHAGFSYVQTSIKPCSNLKSIGPGHAIRCNTILKEIQMNFFFVRGNCRLPPLHRIGVWLGFVHMKTQQIEGVVMAWLSPIESAA